MQQFIKKTWLERLDILITKQFGDLIQEYT